jgi:phosphatidylglycerophosphate synthase
MATPGEAAERRWARVHALAMLAAAGVSLARSSPVPVVLVGAGSLLGLVALGRGRYTPASGFGLANALTLLRLGAIVTLGLLCRATPGPRAALLALAIFGLDGVDGLVARQRGETSEFGAGFDMECDALFVQLCALVLYLHGRVAAFVLLPASLRYLYVVFLAVYPSAAREAPRSSLGRYAFGLFCVSAIASLWPLEPWHRPLALAASALIVYSFARSLYAALTLR